MAYSRCSVDLSGYPDLVVVYLGYRAKDLKGACSLLRIGRGLRLIKQNPPDGLLSHESLPADARRAHEPAANGHTRGKIVLTIA